MKFFLKIAALIPLFAVADDAVTCHLGAVTNWDPKDTCVSGAVAGSNSDCGLTEADPCHITVIDDDSETAPESVCGKCVKMSYKIDTADHVRYGKIIGVEKVDGTRDFVYKVNEPLFKHMNSDTQGTCGTTTVDIGFEDADCPDEVTCWENSQAEWDSDGKCEDVENLPPKSNDSCGATADDPCTVTKAFTTTPTGSDHCGQCVTIKYDKEGTETSLYGIIIGSETTTRWDYRFNEDTYKTKLGGTDATCGEHQNVKAVKSADDGECTDDDEDSTSTGDVSASHAVRIGALVTVAAAVMSI
eukprot:Polyplicarium_translucidae@DN5275_c0_g1_i1.p1